MKVLICDSHRDQSKITEVLRDQAGFEIAGIVGTGAECLSMLTTAMPELVITDANLPDMSGIDLARQILQKTPGIPVLIAAEKMTMEIWRQSIQAGAKGLLRKPVGVEDIKKLLKLSNIPTTGQPESQTTLPELAPAPKSDPVMEIVLTEKAAQVFPEIEKPFTESVEVQKTLVEQNPVHVPSADSKTQNNHPFKMAQEAPNITRPSVATRNDVNDPYRQNERRGKSASKIISVFSPKGGVGKTTLATNLALLYQVYSGRRVCLVEIDRQSGNLVSMLSMASSATITGLVRRGVFQDPGLFYEMMLDHAPTGLKVLPSPPLFSKEPELTNQETQDILNALKELFDIIIVDLGSLLTEAAKVVLRQSEHILLVSKLDVPTLEDCQLVPETFFQENIDLARLTHVVNRYKKDKKYRDDKTLDIAKKLVPFSMYLIPDDSEVENSVNNGQVVVLAKQNSEFVCRLRELANLLVPFEEAKPKGFWALLRRLLPGA